MSILRKKLLRTILKTKAQFLAMTAIVAVGIALYVSMTTAFANLSYSQEEFYLENNFADHYFLLVRAPRDIAHRIENVEGVIRASGRIVKDVSVLREDNTRASARLVSFEYPLARQVNKPRILEGLEKDEGEMFRVWLDPGYFKANNYEIGSEITILAQGKKFFLQTGGTAVSPEFVYIIKDGSSLIPDPETFGVYMLSLNAMGQIFEMKDSVNQVIVQFAPGIDQNKVVDTIKNILEPYGVLSDYPRSEQESHFILEMELEQLAASSRVMPTIFLGIAAAIQIILLRRMIKNNRLQIGIMKAIGYGNTEIIMHYTGYALAITLSGAAIGSLLGLLMAGGISEVYTLYFNLPQSIGGVNPRVLISSFGLSLITGIFAGVSGSKQVLKIMPAEAMRAEAPKGGKRIILEHWASFWQGLTPSWQMSLRSLLRNKMRFLVVLLGVISAVSMLLLSMFSNDSIGYLMEKNFRDNIRYDYLLRFEHPLSEGGYYDLRRLDDIQYSEPLLEIPVRLYHLTKSEDDLLNGIISESRLRRIYDADENEITLPEEGIVLSKAIADKLEVKVGDVIELESMFRRGEERRKQIKVRGINQQLIGSQSYVSIEQANKIIGERNLVSGAMFVLEARDFADFEKEIHEIPKVASISSRQKEIDNFEKSLDSMVYFVGIMSLFAIILGFVIIFNSSLLNLNEREREMATLRVLGFSPREISGFLFKEIIVQAGLGVVIGIPLGRFLIDAYVTSLSTDIYSMPVVISIKTYLISAVGSMLFIMGGHSLASRGIKKLQLVEVLKSRE